MGPALLVEQLLMVFTSFMDMCKAGLINWIPDKKKLLSADHLTVVVYQTHCTDRLYVANKTDCSYESGCTMWALKYLIYLVMIKRFGLNVTFKRCYH